MSNFSVPLKDTAPFPTKYLYYGVAVIFLFLFAYSKHLRTVLNSWRRSLKLNSFPGPPAIPFVATTDFLRMRSEDLFEKLNTWCTQYPGCFKIWMVLQPMVVIHSKENLKRILGSSDHLSKPEAYNVIMGSLIGKNGLATAPVDEWKVHRKILTPALNGRILNDFLDILNEDSVALCSVIRKELTKITGSQSDMGGEGLDMHKHYHRLFLDIIMESVIGIRPNYLDNGVDISLFHPEVMDRTKEVVFYRSKPFLQWDWLWNITPWGKELAYTKTTGMKFYQECINARREQLRSDSAIENAGSGKRLRREAILDTLIKLSENPNSDITDEYMIFELSTFVLAGHGSNAESLGYATFMLTQHPEVQDKCYEEVVSVFGTDIDRPMTFEDLARLTYVDQILKESLRLYPIAPLIMREAGCDVVLEEGYTVPKGSTVAIWFPGLHRDPTVFPNPNSFDPDHFAPDKSDSIDQYAFAPYSAGTRNCIGKKLSTLQLKVVLARLVLHFKFLSAFPNNPKHNAPVNLAPFPRIRIKLQARS